MYDSTTAPGSADRVHPAAMDEQLVGMGKAPCGGTCEGVSGVCASSGGAVCREGAHQGGTQVFRFGGVWHARRQLLNGRLVMGIGYTEALAVSDLESQWRMA